MSGNRFTDERLRESLPEAGEPFDDGHECPDAEQVWLSARRRLEPERNEEILLHVAKCPACAMSWRIAQDMERKPAEAQPSRPARRWQPYWTGLAAAAVIVVAVGFGIFFRPGQVVEQETPYRAQEGVWLQSQLDEAAVLPRDGFVVSWEAGPEGTVYSVLVTSASLEVLAEGVGISTNEFKVPAEALAALPPGSEVLWQVSANLPDGRFVESESYIIRIE